MTKILFVCTGNTCRSVIAEHLTRRRFGESVDVQSAGIRPQQPEDAANAIETLKTYFGLGGHAFGGQVLQSSICLFSETASPAASPCSPRGPGTGGGFGTSPWGQIMGSFLDLPPHDQALASQRRARCAQSTRQPLAIRDRNVGLHPPSRRLRRVPPRL